MYANRVTLLRATELLTTGKVECSSAKLTKFNGGGAARTEEQGARSTAANRIIL